MTSTREQWQEMAADDGLAQEFVEGDQLTTAAAGTAARE